MGAGDGIFQRLTLWENGELIRSNIKSTEEAKRIIAGCDLSMATIDCDPQEYEVRNHQGKLVYKRNRIHVP